MKLTVAIILIIATICIMIAYIFGFYHGISRGIKAREAQYAEEDKAAAESVAKPTKDLKEQCQEEKDYILNNKQGGS